MDEYLEVASEAAREAGAIQAAAYDGSIDVDYKAPTDLVTDIDRRCETVIKDVISDAYPSHAILAEEGGGPTSSDADYRWIVDPLDGTTNFVHGLPHFCVSIALEIDGTLEYGVIYDTPTETLYTGGPDSARVDNESLATSDTTELSDALVGVDLGREPTEDLIQLLGGLNTDTRGFRRLGSAVTHFRLLAAGTLDAMVGIGYAPWDMAAGTVLVRAAGGRVTGPDGGEPGKTIVASNGDLHHTLLAEIA